MFRKGLFLTMSGLILLAMVFPAVTLAQKSNSDTLPITRVILYKHGVGYFERTGLVPGGEQIELFFKKDQMNDLLKSLTVLDLEGGPVDGIVYDSTRTVEQLLNEFTFDLQGDVGLPTMLGQLQGSEIRLMIGTTEICGTIIGVQERKLVTDDTQHQKFMLSILETEGMLKSIDVDEITQLEFTDSRLNMDIQRYLQIMYRQHRKDEKTVSITPGGSGTRKLLVSYVTEAPIWKVSYRIVLTEANSDKPFLQGWAIVDNVSEEDWSDVQLSLVSGLPISFIQNLYDPHYKQRPVIAISKETALTPVRPEAGYGGRLAGRSDMAAEAEAPMAGARLRGAPPRELKAAPSAQAESFSFDMNQAMRGVEAETITRDVGNMFEYSIDHAVTIQRNRSALLPIVAGEVDGKALDLYNESTRKKNPLSAVRIQNTTGLTLEGGPLTVMQGNNYVGEALMDTVKPDDRRYITYAVDLGVLVNTKHDSKREQVDRVIINRGTMRLHRGVIETKTYTLNNKNKSDKTIVLEHPYRQGWDLLEPEKPLEVTDNYKRFEVDVPAGEEVKFPVREKRDDWESIAITNISSEQLAVYVRGNYLSDIVHQQLNAIIELKADIAQLDRQIRNLQSRQESIYSDQKRIRENLRSIGTSPEERKLRTRYIDQLDQQETTLDEIKTKIQDLQNQRNTKQKELDNLIGQVEQDLRI